VTELNRRLTGAQTLEWRPEGATNSTFFDVVSARWEPAYDYRRQSVLLASGTLRVWTKPYGHAGTSRIVGTAAASGIAFVPLGTVAGDADALLRTEIGAVVGALPLGSPTPAKQTLVGMALIASQV